MAIDDLFRRELMAQITRANNQGRTHVEINAVELHRAVGGYDDEHTRRLLLCCESMRAAAKSGDTVVFQPPEGDGAALTIRYNLPR